jgi:hypothetical protein
MLPYERIICVPGFGYILSSLKAGAILFVFVVLTAGPGE